MASRTFKAFLRSSLVVVPLVVASLAPSARGGDPRLLDATATAILSVRLVALRNDNGQVGCGLWSSERGFPKDRSVAVQTKWCPVASKESRCAFDPIPAGTYAVACFHVENGNRILDTGLFGIPLEGVVASNHAKGFMGPPSFNDAKFSFSGTPTELRLTMGY